MNIFLPGYQIVEAIHEGVNTLIYRAVRESDNTKAIVKTLKATHPTLDEITRLRHEYKILQPLNIPGIPKPISLENYKNGLALILADFGGDSLKDLMSQQKIAVSSALSIGIQVASVLAELHKNHIIHKDIKPHNILIDPEKWIINLIDFSIATRLSRETATISNPDSMEGTLAYMSPEQTGRMNRSIDYRTDFYSLGVTLYEILTGQVPFQVTDAMELVHCHIAIQPLSPHELNPEIHPLVSDIVMKLLAKTSEDRYQSALGLKADLENCCHQLAINGKIENFIPGELDKSGQFLIPQKLYGREEEVAQLMAAFVRVASGKENRVASGKENRVAGELAIEEESFDQLPITNYRSEMMLVSGYSGIGKTAVVNEVHKPIVAKRGYFSFGKFDQFKRNIPYAALVSAFQDLMRQLLTESDEKIAEWKAKLLEAFGQNGQLIVDVIPEVESIVGKQPEVPSLPPTESQNRFNGTFQKFIQVFAQKEHPLVLFLDDLQWADSASLKSIELLMTDGDSKHLLLIGAYRDNEVSPVHATIQTIEKIQQAGAVVNNIVLQPLNFSHVSRLVADTVGGNLTPQPLSLQEKGELEEKGENYYPDFASVGLEERSNALAELLFNKTGGNPFFLTQLLSTLHQEKLLTFDFSEGRWLWNIEKIQAIGITDYNVVELVARNIQKLGGSTQQILKLAACIGNQFNLDVLAIVNEKSMLTSADDLWEALQAGLILPMSNAYKIPLFVDESEQGVLKYDDFRVSYKFLHDRVQQAAYSLIPEDEKKETHLKIGKLLLQKTGKVSLEENVFDIVNQLNIGVEFITDRAEKDELAALNLMAGKKAIASNAYEAALRYLNVGLQVLTADSWQNQYDLTLAVYESTVAAEYLNTNFERASQLSDIVLDRAKNLLDKIPIYERKIQFYIAQSQMQEAIDTALTVLKLLGVSLAKNPSKLNILMGLLTTKFNLIGKRIEELTNLPEMTDPYKIAAMRILYAIIVPAYVVNPLLFPQVLFTTIELSFKYGNCSLSAEGYCMYGLLLSGAMGDINSGYKFGQVALKLVDKFDARELKSRVSLTFNGGIRHWKEHARETIEPFIEAIQNALEVGDIKNAACNAAVYCEYIILAENNLESVAQKQAKYIDLIVNLKQESMLYYANIYRQLALNLMDKSADRLQLIGENFNEEEMIPFLQKNQSLGAVFYIYFAKAILAYLFKKYDLSVENAELAEKYLEGAIGNLAVAIHNLYYSLAILALYNTNSKNQQKQYLSKVVSNQKRMKQWAFHAPANFQHKYELVEAEKARVLGQYEKAAEYYDASISGAKEQGYIQEEALANELAAEFYFSRNREKIALVYLTESYYGYIRWGAKAKVKDLEERYPQFFSQLLKRETPALDITRTTNSTTGGSSSALDITTVMKASQAISSEIVLDKLLAKLMQVLIENAGARKGLFFVYPQTPPGKEAGKLVLATEGAVEKDKLVVMRSIPVERRPDLPGGLINYVERTRETVVLNNATSEGLFTTDPYILRTKPKSILCMPLSHQGKVNGILYLENNLTVGAFTEQRCHILKLLAAQASISLEKAGIYQTLQASEMREREKATQLEKALYNLQQTQAQLVQTEKISSLGQLVAGVAHEVNNPVSFISGNIHHTSEYIQSLIDLVNLYQEEYPNPTPKIQDRLEAIEVDYLIEDLPKILFSMKVGTERIREIMQSLRNFSRVDTAEKRPSDIHAGIESTLMILQHRLKATGELKAIRVVKEYGDLPPVMCYSGQLNQVFMNLLANAIDAMDEARLASEKEIRIRTEVIEGGKVAIRIKDNGPGMTEEVRSKLFDPFFTTKPEGKGTGLGLSISHQIVVEKHGGNIECISAPGVGAEFAIAIPVGQQSLQIVTRKHA